MSKIQLGTIEQVDLREIWKHEALDFTRWLSEDDNLGLLGDAVGMELELRETESAIGPFNVDIFAVDTGSGARVIIENQLEDTDHDHLGKIITYAAGKDAGAVVWVVARARDEHRQAIEWLNRHTDDGCAFFLVEVEVWRIGDSMPAPRFNVVESPNEWARAERSKENMGDTQKLQVEYWQRYRELALADEAFSRHMKPQKAQPQHWSTVSVGSSKYHLNLQVLIQKKVVGLELYVSDEKEIGQKAADNLALLEEAVGVEGVTFSATKASGVRFYKHHCDIKGHPDKWDEYITWQLGAIVRLREAIMRLGL